MRIKTNIKEGAVSEVRFIEGIVALGKVKLNVYCFENDGMLIDTGAPRLLSDFTRFFEKASFDQVVLTHSHEDHVGGAAYIQEKYHVPVYINQRSVEACKQEASYPFYRKVFWGKRAPFHAEALKETFQSRHATWDVIKTPGHADDHLSFLNRETGQLFSGDLYVHPETKLVLRNESVPTIMESIRLTLGYDFEEMFCCHAGYVKNGRQKLQGKLNYLEELQGKIHDLDQKGYSEKEIKTELFGKRFPITYVSLGEWDSIHMIRSILRESHSDNVRQ